MAIPRTPLEIIRLALDQAKETIHTALPARVHAWYPSTQTVDAEIVVSMPYIDDTGELAYHPPPVVPQVPVAWPRFGPFTIAGPLNVGDELQLICSQLSLEDWRTTGQPSDPVDVTKHVLAGWAVPVNTQDARVLSDDLSQLVIGVAGGTQIRIAADGSSIDLGGGATDYVALASLVHGELTKIAATLATGLDSLSKPVTWGTPYVTPGNVASNLVKSK